MKPSEVLDLNNFELEFLFRGYYYTRKTEIVNDKQDLNSNNINVDIDPNYDLRNPEVRKRIENEVMTI